MQSVFQMSSAHLFLPLSLFFWRQTWLLHYPCVSVGNTQGRLSSPLALAGGLPQLLKLTGGQHSFATLMKGSVI